MLSDDSILGSPVLDKKSTSDDRTQSDDSHVALSSHGEPIVTRRELWSYYLYFNGDAGVPIQSASTIFQKLVTYAGYDPVRGPGSSCIGARASGECVLPWGSGTKPVTSVILLASGMSFAMITVILTAIGPASDYGSFGRWPLLVSSLIYWGSMFSTITLTSPNRWGLAMGIYIIGYICYGLTFAFYAAIFPRLARNTRQIRGLKERYDRGEITVAEYQQAESLEKSRISSFSSATGAVGYVAVLLLDLALLLPLSGNRKVNNYVILMSTAYGVLTGIWWFVFQQPRPGPKLPKGENYFTIGWKQLWTALKQYRKLPNTFVYLFAYFLFADAVNTSVTLVHICQNLRFTFSFLDNTYLSLVLVSTSGISMVTFWYIQRQWKIDSKKMFMVTNAVAILLTLWGMIGIWTTKFGYHNKWEFWVHKALYELFQAPYFSYSQTVMAELSPPGFDFMFFGLFGLTARASSILGPYVIQAIIERTDNTWQGFSFLFAITVASSLIFWFAVDVHKGRRDAERWAAEQRGAAFDSHSAF